ADRPVLGLGGALAPGGELAGDRAGSRAELVHARQPPVGGFRIALVGHVLEPAALLARPLEPLARPKPSLELISEGEHVLHVTAGVLELLRGERPVVPAREAGSLGQPDAQRALEQVPVAGLRA